MHVGNGLSELRKAIDNFLNSAEKQQTASTTDSEIHVGQIAGDFLTYKDGNYPYIPAVDVSTTTGDYVLFQLSGGVAYVIGKP